MFKNKTVNKVVLIPMEQIVPNPMQPRREFKAFELVSLSESIKENGLLQPITLRKTQGGYEIIAGERRWRACKLAGRKNIEAVVMDVDQKQSATLALIENIQRQDLNCFEQAHAIAKLIEITNLTQAQAATRLGMAQSSLANKLRLLNLNEEAANVVVKEQLTERHARALLALPDNDQRAAAEVIAKRKYNVAAAEKYISSLLQEKPEQCKVAVLRDVRIFMNTIDKAVSLMKQAGVECEFNTQKSDCSIDCYVHIPIEQKAEVV